VVAKQGRDGLWRDFFTPAGEASEWPTGFIATALRLAGAEAAVLRRAAETLVANQNDDGGWGYNESVPSDADSTACVLLFLARMGRGGSTCRHAASLLVRHQHSENGGIATYDDPNPIRRFMGLGRWVRFAGWCRPHTEVTAMAGRAFAALSPDNTAVEADAAWRYVQSQQCADGSWKSYWWTSPHYTTLQAVELAVLMAAPDAVGRAAEWALRRQAPDGGWSAPGAETSAFATALSLSLILRAREDGQAVERAVARLGALQEEDGGWASHPILRIPLPGDVNPDRKRRWRLGGPGLLVQDQHRAFTSAVCVAALAQACKARRFD
jgi:squalene-hopene/tetraprenyl-beta-curcumene cyclase/sporulenol synthase